MKKKKKTTSSAHNLIIISAFPLDSHLTWTPSKSASSFLPISTHRIINTTYSRVKFSQMIIIFTIQSTYLNKIEDLGIACLCCWKIHWLQTQFGIPVVSAKESVSSIFVFNTKRAHVAQHKRHMTSYYYLVSLPALKISEFPRIMQSYFENYYYRKQFSNFNAHQSHLEDFLEGRLLGTSSRLPDSVGLWWAQEFACLTSSQMRPRCWPGDCSLDTRL